MDLAFWKEKAKRLKSEIYALYLASKDPRTPWYSKVLAVLIVGYALSPIDLIPDFIPALGYLDDLVIVPGGIALLLRLIPREIMDECRERARTELANGKTSHWIAAAIIVSLWLLGIYVVVRMIW